MRELIDLKSYPVKNVLNILLEDKTTKKNIIWATRSYEAFGEEYSDDRQMTETTLLGLNQIVLQPRVLKALEQQQERTKARAEVFTPSWICNKMNNYCDEEWFGRKNVFNVEKEQSWECVTEKVFFPVDKNWKQYVDSRRLEITCAEAPYLVSRYDVSTGESIPFENRIGILDRKLRVINENTENQDEWYKWVVRAFQSSYGYEFQGDNLLIGRINLLMTFVDCMMYKWQKEPDEKELRKIANIIAWNLWQMDGLTGTVPLGVPDDENYQYSLFDLFEEENLELEKVVDETTPRCRIFDWRADRSIMFEELKERKTR